MLKFQMISFCKFDDQHFDNDIDTADRKTKRERNKIDSNGTDIYFGKTNNQITRATEEFLVE